MSELPPTAPRLTIHKPKPTRQKTTDRGYGHHWQQVRKIKIQQSPFCELKLEGCTGWADQVHHKSGDTRDCSEANLQSVCQHCHQLHHNRTAEG
jgi:hypothetical protein